MTLRRPLSLAIGFALLAQPVTAGANLCVPNAQACCCHQAGSPAARRSSKEVLHAAERAAHASDTTGCTIRCSDGAGNAGTVAPSVSGSTPLSSRVVAALPLAGMAPTAAHRLASAPLHVPAPPQKRYLLACVLRL